MIILADRSNINDVISEAKSDWVNQMLINLGISEHVLRVLPLDQSFSLLHKNAIEVCDHLGEEAVEIKQNSEVVALWEKPLVVPKIEDGKLYYEIHIRQGSIFDDQEGEDE